tara:strand:- start:587 stop:2749 length:2163 start_codon:yes stop_codon:yes gene_type:complete
MAKCTSKMTLDERWGGHMDIGNRGNVSIQVKKLEHYTIELWLRLKKYPIIHRKKDNQQVLVDPTVLTVGNVRVTYDDKKIKFKDHKTLQAVYINYEPEQWFQLAISNGKTGSLGYDTGSIYINGKEVNTTMIFPPDISLFKIGNDLQAKDKVLINTNYESESSLGVVRIYQRVMSKHEIYNNYLAQAKQYALLMKRSASPISDSLVMELLPEKEHYDKTTNYWYSTKQVIKRRATNKNPIKDYKMSRTDELTKLLQSLQFSRSSVPPQHSPPAHPQQGATEVGSNIIILSRNPEMFMKHLKNPADLMTKQLMTQGQNTPMKHDYDGIFDNPFKIKLLVNYLQSNPEHFLDLLKSDALNQEQLITLSNALNGRGMTQVNKVVEGFTSGPMGDPTYDAALGLLQQQIMLRPLQRPSPPNLGVGHAPYVNDLVTSTSTIARIMADHHKTQKLNEKLARRAQFMDTIRYLNSKIKDSSVRTDKLEHLLAQQNKILGLILSKNNGKCVGTIDLNGKIKHCEHKHAKSPYDIIVNSRSYGLSLNNILQQHRLTGATVEQILEESKQNGMTVLGQCINTTGKTIGLLVRMGKSNHYIPTVESNPVPSVPILAILAPNKHKEDLSQCSSGKCEPGYHAVENTAVGDKDWLQEGETEEEALANIKNAQANPSGQSNEETTGAPLDPQEAAEEIASLQRKIDILENGLEEEDDVDPEDQGTVVNFLNSFA